jgi:hypothetical protein
MKPIYAFGSVALVFAVAIASTVTGMKVSQRVDYADNLRQQILADQARIQVLRTELAYLSSPQRVQALVDLHRPDLKTPGSQQYVLAVSDLLPQTATAPQIIPTIIHSRPRAEADRLIAVSQTAVVPPAAEAPPRETSIEDIIASADEVIPAARTDLSDSLEAVVQNIAAKDVTRP